MHTTVREANDRGYECLVLSDCVGSYFPEFQRVGLAMIAAQGGIFGWVAAVQQYIDAFRSSHRRLALQEGCGVTTPTDECAPIKLPWWVSGDTNAFFGLGFNILVNVLVLTRACASAWSTSRAREVFGVDPARARRPAADRQRLLHLPRAPAGAPRGPAPTSARCRTGPACRTCSSSSS